MRTDRGFPHLIGWATSPDATTSNSSWTGRPSSRRALASASFIRAAAEGPRRQRARRGDTQPVRRIENVKWVTREHPKTDRIACPWLIRKFIDPDAEIVYVPPDQVLEYAEREGATSFDAPGAKYTHRGNRCSFETLVDEYKINDPAIAVLAKVVHGADVSAD